MLIGFGAAGGQEVAATLGFVAEEVDAEGNLCASLNAFLVSARTMGGGRREGVIQADDEGFNGVERHRARVKQGANNIAADEIMLNDFQIVRHKNRARTGVAGYKVVNSSAVERSVFEEDAAEGDATGRDEGRSNVAAGAGAEDATCGVASSGGDLQVVERSVSVIADEDRNDTEGARRARNNDDKAGITGW